ncbi:MAG: hypothetical protein EOP07_05800 [Proteobacteria bacterium]|nr:MAG: hypothetical protein EOP07_05800 [Pseudomonadota bacterium]
MSTSMKTVLLICPVLLSFACSDKKKFGGDVAASKIPAVADATPNTSNEPSAEESSDAPVVTPAPGKVIPTTCSSATGDITKVTLLSSGVNLAINNQTLRYELSVLSCKDGSVVPIKDQTISFDLNLSTTNGFKDIAYSVLDPMSSKTISSGPLETVVGSDLFGNKGNVAHWVTKSMSYSSTLDKVILEINLKNIRLQAQDALSTEAESYLQVGTAAAVTQKLKILDQ